jgi:hypothetical protein
MKAMDYSKEALSFCQENNYRFSPWRCLTNTQWSLSLKPSGMDPTNSSKGGTKEWQSLESGDRSHSCFPPPQ